MPPRPATGLSKNVSYFLRALRRAIRRGDLFPAAGRRPAEAAPGGSRVLEEIGGGPELDRLQITAHRVPLPLRRPVRILHLSDIHLRGEDARLDLLIRVLQPMRPDLLVLTGDVVAHGWEPPALRRLLSALPPAPLGRFAVIGNWEYWGGAPVPVWAPLLAQHGIDLLHNRGVQLPEAGMNLTGTDDALAGTPDLDAAFAGLAPGWPTVALTHSPVLFPDLAQRGADLVLAGHTHGGQIRFPLAGPFFLPRGSGSYPWGWYREGTSWLFVSRGIGWSVGPIRWGARPEVAWVEIG